MTDAIPAANDAAQSQVIENREADATALGRGAEVTPEAAPKPDAKEAPKSLSTREALEKAFREGDTKREAEKSAKPDAKDDTRPDDAKAEKAKADAPKDNAAVKTDAKAEETAPKAEQGAPDKAAAGQGGDEVRPSEGRKHVDPPARFLPEARAKWANTPNEIKAEMHRVSEEYETRIQETKQSADKFEAVRQFDEMAERNGRGGVKGVIENVSRIEDALQRNPIAGLELVLREAGIKHSLQDVAKHIAQMTPQQFSQAIGQNGQQQQQQPQRNPEVDSVRQELQSLRSEMASAKVAPVVEQFENSHADYRQLESQIASILRSGVIEEIYGTGLEPGQKLEQAYRMAGGQGPSSQSEAPAIVPDHSQAPAARPEQDPDGAKSIKGAPNAGQSGTPKRKFNSNRDALAAAFAEMR